MVDLLLNDESGPRGPDERVQDENGERHHNLFPSQARLPVVYDNFVLVLFRFEETGRQRDGGLGIVHI